MNNTIQDLIHRRSCRRYRPEQIREDQLDQILLAGTYAPTGMGKQSPRIVVVQDKATLDKIRALNAQVAGMTGDPFYGAPTVVIVFADTNIPTYLYDGVLVMGNLLNAAHAVGVDSCYIFRAKQVFQTPEGKALLAAWGIPEHYEGIGNCILGYGDEGGIRPALPRKDDYIIRA